jgi:uncharacterized membrane protein (UPF0127 family)
MIAAARSLFLVLLLLAGTAVAQGLQTYQKQPLSIETAGGKKSFTVELALTPAQQSQGLMFRKSMAPDAGMLFVFPEEREQAFWMRNTYLPLDMIFIRADGSILSIAERTVPLTDDPVPSRGPARAVLELNGGSAQRLGIKPGDKVTAEALQR